MSAEVAVTRLKWLPSGWGSLVSDPGITSDIDGRALAVGVQAEVSASETATVRVDAGMVRRGRRYRAAVIAYDVPGRRDDTYRALLAALDAGR